MPEHSNEHGLDAHNEGNHTSEEHSAGEWTPAQQEEFTHLYQQYEHAPNYNREKAYNDLFSSQLPFEEAKGKLEELMSTPAQHSAAHNESLEHKTNSSHSSHPAGKKGFQKYLTYGAAAVLAVAGLYAGLTYVPKPA